MGHEEHSPFAGTSPIDRLDIIGTTIAGLREDNTPEADAVIREQLARVAEETGSDYLRMIAADGSRGMVLDHLQEILMSGVERELGISPDG